MRTFDQIKWDFNPKIPKQEILAFRNSSWIEEARNLVLIGDVGIAKSHIVKSLLYDAALSGYTALFISVFDLISKIKSSPTPPSHRALQGSKRRSEIPPHRENSGLRRYDGRSSI
jgi:DNA replication protein DnaC